MVARLEEIPLSSVEHAAGRQVVQYRGAILPLIDVREVIGCQPSDLTSESLQVIVFAEQGRSVGLVVDQIIDTVEHNRGNRQRSGRPGILGSSVIQGKVTDIIDVPGVIRCADPDFFSEVVS